MKLNVEVKVTSLCLEKRTG